MYLPGGKYIVCPVLFEWSKAAWIADVQSLAPVESAPNVRTDTMPFNPSLGVITVPPLLPPLIVILPEPNIDSPLIVLIFVPLTKVSCFCAKSVLVANLLVSIEPVEVPGIFLVTMTWVSFITPTLMYAVVSSAVNVTGLWLSPPPYTTLVNVLFES